MYEVPNLAMIFALIARPTGGNITIPLVLKHNPKKLSGFRSTKKA
jgi:hypothetical protein